MLKREWFSASDIADLNLPDMPASKRNVTAMADRLGWRRADKINRWWRLRDDRGGGHEYHYSVLPPPARATWLHLYNEIETGTEQAAAVAAGNRNAARWAWFLERPKKTKDEARRRLLALDAVRLMVADGSRKLDAVLQICDAHKIEQSTYYNWEKLIGSVPRHDWLPFLAPKHKGRQTKATFSDEAWEYYKTSYLNLLERTAEQCYRDLVRDGKPQGWTIPSLRTLQRMVDKMDQRVVTLLRKGKDALDKMYPAQERDRSVFAAMEALNADGHKFDLRTLWPDSVISRPILVAFQDLYSGMIVSWRLGRSETSEMVRLAYGEAAEKFAIPKYVYFDNGRAFTAKENTGGTPNIYRGKIKEEDPEGIIVACGSQVKFVKPGHGQSKPLERAWRDMASDIAKDIKCKGAYTGNSTLSKPEDYGSKAIPIEDFYKIVHAGIIEHNERVGRETDACQGKLSFRQAFDQSFANSVLPKLPVTHRSIWHLSSVGIKAHATDGSLRFMKNRFHAEFMTQYAGKYLTIRFDPDAIKAGVHVYDTNDRFLGIADCVERTGFNDMDGAKKHAKAKGAVNRAVKALAEAELSLTIPDLIAMRAPVEEPAPPMDTKVVRFMARGNTALQQVQQLETEESPQDAARFEALRQMNRAKRDQGHLRVVPDDDED